MGKMKARSASPSAAGLDADDDEVPARAAGLEAGRTNGGRLPAAAEFSAPGTAGSAPGTARSAPGTAGSAPGTAGSGPGAAAAGSGGARAAPVLDEKARKAQAQALELAIG